MSRPGETGDYLVPIFPKYILFIIKYAENYCVFFKGKRFYGQIRLGNTGQIKLDSHTIGKFRISNMQTYI